MGVDWDKLVEQRNAWVAHNFPTHTEDDPIIGSIYGCIEELGELAHAHLKEDQGIRGSAEEHQAAAKDAVGDLSVYLMGVMSHMGVRPVGERDEDKARKPLLSLAGAVGAMAEDHATGTLHDWAEVLVDAVVDSLRYYCEKRGWDYDEIVRATWDHVKQRDWIKYPGTGWPPGSEENPVAVEVSADGR